MTILTVLTSLYSLLAKPNLFYPQDIDAGLMYFQDFFEYRRKAMLWTQIYASSSFEFKSLPGPTKAEWSTHLESDRKKKEVLDIYDYFEWRIRPKQKK